MTKKYVNPKQIHFDPRSGSPAPLDRQWCLLFQTSADIHTLLKHLQNSQHPHTKGTADLSETTREQSQSPLLHNGKAIHMGALINQFLIYELLFIFNLLF